MRQSFLIPSIVLALGLIIGGWVLGHQFFKSRMANKYVTVKGLAEMPVKADLGVWSLESNNDGDSFDGVRNELNRQAQTIQSWLKQKGFADGEIKVETINVRRNYYTQNGQPPYNGSVKVSLQTSKVDELETASGSTSELLDRGVFLNGDEWTIRPKFYFTKINDVKSELLAEATKAARSSAEQFANDSGAKVGGIKQANQGIIVLMPGNRIEESHEFYKDKIARVVSTIDYYIQ